MQAYNVHIQSLNALIVQLLAAQRQQEQPNSTLTPARKLIKCDVAVQSELPSPCTSDDIGESVSMLRSNRDMPPTPKIEQLPHCQQQPLQIVLVESLLFIKNISFVFFL